MVSRFNNDNGGFLDLGSRFGEDYCDITGGPTNNMRIVGKGGNCPEMESTDKIKNL